MHEKIQQKIHLLSKESQNPISEFLANRTHQRLPKRAAMGVICLGFKGFIPRSVSLSASLGGLLPKDSHEIGSGAQQFVYANNSDQTTVRKIIIGSNTFSREDAHKSAFAYAKRFEKFASYMGPYLQPTEYTVERLRPFGVFVVSAEQDYLQDLKGVFSKDSIVPGVLESIDHKSDIRDFTTRALEHFTDTGTIVDLLGDDNLATSDRRLVVIDSIELPHVYLGQRRPCDGVLHIDIVRSQIESLRAAA